jgi:hypothetical protein
VGRCGARDGHTSFGFIAFVAAVVVAFPLVPSRGWRTAVLSLANAAFIATYINKPQQIIPLLAFLLLDYLAIEAVRRRRSALAAAISIGGAVLTIFVYLKRFSFLGNNYRCTLFIRSSISPKELMRNNRVTAVLVVLERWCSSSRLGRHCAEC